MTRPRYETFKDREVEREIFGILEGKWKCEITPAPDFSCYDGLIKKQGRHKGIVIFLSAVEIVIMLLTTFGSGK